MKNLVVTPPTAQFANNQFDTEIVPGMMEGVIHQGGGTFQTQRTNAECFPPQCVIS